MKRILAWGVTAPAVTALRLFLAGAALAEEPVAAEQRPGFGGRTWDCTDRGADWAWDAVAGLLGLCDEELHVARAEGLTLADVAEEKGVRDENLLLALTMKSAAAIESSLADGKLTEEQAKWLLSGQASLAGHVITDPFAPGEGLPMGRGARGMQARHFGRQSRTGYVGAAAIHMLQLTRVWWATPRYGGLT